MSLFTEGYQSALVDVAAVLRREGSPGVARWIADEASPETHERIRREAEANGESLDIVTDAIPEQVREISLWG